MELGKDSQVIVLLYLQFTHEFIPSSKQKSSLSSKGRVSDLGEFAAVHHVQMDLLSFGDETELGDEDPAVTKDAETLSVAGSDTTRIRQEKEARTVGGIPSR